MILLLWQFLAASDTRAHMCNYWGIAGAMLGGYATPAISGTILSA